MANGFCSLQYHPLRRNNDHQFPAELVEPGLDDGVIGIATLWNLADHDMWSLGVPTAQLADEGDTDRDGDRP